ncbi:uncharacterized protein LOC116029819 [Ipomoea triloba]|uniref:uncharacterized protein LOC116029819 n=1 Tax=Ipomoea triloba TaxID=35885 RepID=UPI00125D36A9|nr:uncharacterized protein LOC116029819 [Ipomoea triloba]
MYGRITIKILVLSLYRIAMPPRRTVENQGAQAGNVLTNVELAQTVQQLAQLTQALGDHLLQNNNGNGNNMAKIVARRNPPTFLGQEDPLVLVDWVRAFDKLYDAVNCPADRRVDIAVYYLQQQADLWWAAVGPTLRQRPNFGWEAFKDAMREKFYPEHVRVAKYDEFLHLRHGNKTVQGYYLEFINLARFAPTLVPNEPSKFIRGLNFETQKGLSMFDFQTLEDAYNRAARHFRVQQIQREINGKNKRRNEENHPQGDKKPKFSHSRPNRNFQRRNGHRNGHGY